MVKKVYHKQNIELFFETPDGQVLDFDAWGSEIDNPVYFNIVNDLLVNGSASLVNSKIVLINYEDIKHIDEFEYNTLELPKLYPFDIFIDISGAGLKDTNLKLKYNFQDFAFNNGSGNIIFRNDERKGAHLQNNDFEYLLNPQQFVLLKQVELFNDTIFADTNSILKELSEIQSLAMDAKAVLAAILVDTRIISPKKVKLDLIPVAKDKYKLIPILEEVDNKKFNHNFEIFPRAKSDYSIREGNKRTRVVIDDKENEDTNSLKTELQKLKKKNQFTGDEINEMYNSITKFWDSDFIDLDDFSERVLKLGVYKPRFYPFISPFKSEWIPGIVIEDLKEGTQNIPIKNINELEELKKLVDESKRTGANHITFKDRSIDLANIQSIIQNAEEQLRNPRKPITSKERENNKPDSDTKVLIIKENAEENEYSEVKSSFEVTTSPDDIKYRLEQINNLSNEIKLKDHQENGVAWLQTLSSHKYSFPGVLLADDMGLGKTLQVLYFIEWFNQKKSKKPVLIVAPVSLLENWQNEYQKFFHSPSLKVITLWGSNVRNYIFPNDRIRTRNSFMDSSIYLTTYETLRRQQIPLGLIDWSVVVLDEAQKVKTPGTLVTNAAKALKADFKIAMTGTPVENSLMDLWCIIDFCYPGLLENAKEFSKRYQKPLNNKETDLQDLSEKLRSRIGRTLLRRMKADVAKDLPSIDYLKQEECMPKVQFDSYLSELAAFEESKMQGDSSNRILQGIFNLRSISDHPFLKHYQIENISIEKLISSSAKLKKLIAILSEIKQEEEKAIVFTENKSMQRVLRKMLSERFYINPTIINGETPSSKSKINTSKLSRQQEIDRFQNSEGFNVIVMSPIAAGFGLNITEANHIIHYTRHWNPAKEQQATDRAYRIGQKKPVRVYYPFAISPNKKVKTFDIILDELLERKSRLASSTLFPTEQIEISKDDFFSSFGHDSSSHKSVKINNIEDLDNLNPLSFEAAVAVLLEKKFNGDSYLTPISNDKGADIAFFGSSANYLIQVKQSSKKLGITSGQEISYALREYQDKLNRDFVPWVISNNYFTDNARELALHNKIELIDRDTIIKWIREYNLTIEDIEKALNKRLSNTDI